MHLHPIWLGPPSLRPRLSNQPKSCNRDTTTPVGVVFCYCESVKRLLPRRNSVTNRRGHESNKRVKFRRSQVTSSLHSRVFRSILGAFGDLFERGGTLFDKNERSGGPENDESLGGPFSFFARPMASYGA